MKHKSSNMNTDGKCNGNGQHSNNGRSCSNENHISGSNSPVDIPADSTSHLAPPSKVCRDFLRKVCRRGNRCKFVHINPNEDAALSPALAGDVLDDGCSNAQPAGCGTAVSATQGSTRLTFCHDYQNNHCNRNCCKFIHCTCEEENQYLQTGHIPPHVLDQAIRKGQMADATLNGDIPICKDYLMGECEKRRGGKCKFRHLNQAEYHQEIYGYSNNLSAPSVNLPSPHHIKPHGPDSPPRDLSDKHCRLNGCGRRMDDRGMMDGRGVATVHPYESELVNNGHHHDGGSGRPPHPNLLNGEVLPDHKRPRLDPGVCGYQGYHSLPRDSDYSQDRDYVHGLTPENLLSMPRDLNTLMDCRGRELVPEWDRQGIELAVMRKQLDDLKKEINTLKKENSDLRATNDFLLDKVTVLGARKLNGHVATSTTLASVSLATNPATLVASTISPLSAAAAAQVTPVSHAIAIGPALTMTLPQQTVAHTTIAAPPTIAPQSLPQPSDCAAGVQHPLSNPMSITSISTDGSSVVAIATPSQPPPPTQPPSQPPPQSLVPSQAVAVATAPPTAAVVVSVGTVQVPLSQASITISSGTINPRITTSSMSMSLPSITAPTIVPSLGQTITAIPAPPAVAAANIAQAISMSQGAQALSMSQGGSPISMSQGIDMAQAISISQVGPQISMSQGVPQISISQGAQAIAMSQGGPPISMSQGGPITMNAPPISMSAPPISMAGPPISMAGPPISMAAPQIAMSAPQAIAMSGPQSLSMSGAPTAHLLSYPIMSQQSLRTQLH